MQSAEAILDGELLRAFAVFAQTLNFTRAARLVSLSQPALFERIQRLQQAVGARLYERAGRALRLTAAGQRTAAFAREELARAGAFLGGGAQAEPSAVTLAAGEGATLFVLGPALRRFARGRSGELRLLTAGAVAAVDAVRSGEADLAVTVVDVVPHGLVAEEVLRAPMCVAVPARHRLARLRRVRLDDLAGERLALPPTGRLYRDLVARLLARGGEPLAPPLEADGWPLMLALVRWGLAIAVVNGACEPPPGVRLRPLDELGAVTYRLLRRKGAALSPAAEALARAIRGPRG